MKKIILLFITVFVCVNVLKAQFAKPTYTYYPDSYQAQELLKRPLIIEIKAVDAKTRKKLETKEPEALKFEESYNEYYQASLKYFFENNYKGSKEISFKTSSEIDQLMASGSTQYSILRAGSVKLSYEMSGKTISENTYSFMLYLSEDKVDKMTVSFLNDILTDPDYLFLVQQINNILKEATENKVCPTQGVLIKGYAEKAKGKTLIVSAKALSEKLTKENILAVYKHPIQFIDDELVYDSLILAKTKDILYITATFSPLGIGINYLIVDAETGEVLLNLNAGGLTVSIGARPSVQQMKQMGYSNTSIVSRNRFYTEFVKFKPKQSFGKSHYAYLNSFAKVKEEKKKKE